LARLDEVERRLVEWAEWRRNARDRERLAGRTFDPDAGVPRGVRQMERIVASMLGRLKETLLEVYVERGSMAAHAVKLGCPETAVARRLGRAHLFIADHLAADGQREREERHRVDAAERLARKPAPESQE
jgi:DNA-directed RNA polymerase specialized sigma24 family protein